METPPKDKSFNLVVKVITAEKNKVQAQSCVSYTGDGENSGMAIMEFGLPSGFSLDRDDVEKVRCYFSAFRFQVSAICSCLEIIQKREIRN